MSEAAGETRIESLDVIRGFALLGILAVNAPAFAAIWQTSINPALPPLAVNDATLWSWLWPHVLLEGKCITLFSMLFGASLYLVGGARSDEGDRLLARRFVVLLGFGLIHGFLIWDGDILVIYALSGLVVMLLRDMKARDLLIFGAVLYIAAQVLLYQAGVFLAQLAPDVLQQTLAEIWAPDAAEVARLNAAYRGGALSATAENATSWMEWFLSAVWFIAPAYGGMMMVGLGLFKLGFLSGRAPAWVYGIAIVIGAGALVLIAAHALESARLGFPALRMIGEASLINRLLAPLASLGYAAALILLLRVGAMRSVLAPLAAAGRMAFSNYIAQSLIMTGIFWGGRGLGWFGQVDRPTLLLIVAGVWPLQLAWSLLWLQHFRRGPLEWVWRSLTVRRVLPLR